MIGVTEDGSKDCKGYGVIENGACGNGRGLDGWKVCDVGSVRSLRGIALKKAAKLACSVSVASTHLIPMHTGG